MNGSARGSDAAIRRCTPPDKRIWPPTAGLLARGCRLRPAFPNRRQAIQWPNGARLTAYSCGGSRSFAAAAIFGRSG